MVFVCVDSQSDALYVAEGAVLKRKPVCRYRSEGGFTLFLKAASLDSREDLSHGVRLPDPAVLGGD